MHVELRRRVFVKFFVVFARGPCVRGLAHFNVARVSASRLGSFAALTAMQSR